MNRFSNSTETPPQDASTQIEDWELKMSKLMGLSIEESINTDNDSNKAQSSSQNFNLSTDSPQEARTEQALSANPLAKLGLVATVTLGIVVVAGVFLSEMLKSGNQTRNQNRYLVSEKKSPPKSESQESTQVEELKTKLALSGQIEAMKAAQETLIRPRPVAVIKTAIDPQSVKIVYVPKTRLVSVERIVKVPQPKTSQPTFVSKVIPQRPQSKLSNLENRNNSQVSQLPSVATTVTEPVNTPSVTPSPLQHYHNPVSANSLATNTPQKSLIASGSTIKGVLATSVFGETTSSTNNNPNEKEKNVFVVRLVEPLKSIDGTVVLPENTELLTQINILSEQGLLTLNVTKVVKKTNGTLTEISLPKNAMSISSVEGKPLIANQHPNQGSSIAGLDIGLFLLGGFGKIAELSNRTQSQVVTTNAAGSVITNANPRSNAVAGFIEGGSNSVVPQIAQRNQQAISTMMQRTNIWFLPAETPVEIHVNQLLEF